MILMIEHGWIQWSKTYFDTKPAFEHMQSSWLNYCNPTKERPSSTAFSSVHSCSGMAFTPLVFRDWRLICQDSASLSLSLRRAPILFHTTHYRLLKMTAFQLSILRTDEHCDIHTLQNWKKQASWGTDLKGQDSHNSLQGVENNTRSERPKFTYLAAVISHIVRAPVVHHSVTLWRRFERSQADQRKLGTAVHFKENGRLSSFWAVVCFL